MPRFRSPILAATIICAALAGPTSIALANGTSDMMDSFMPVEIDPATATGDDIIDILAPYLDGYPEGTEGRQNASISIESSEGGYDVEIINTGFLDDSLEGEHYRGRVEPTADGWELIELNKMVLCYRGEPQDGLCP